MRSHRFSSSGCPAAALLLVVALAGCGGDGGSVGVGAGVGVGGFGVGAGVGFGPGFAVSSLNLRSVTAEAVTLDWTNVGGAAQYAVVRNARELLRTTALTAVDTAVAPGQTYCYWVVALRSDGAALGSSNERCATPPRPDWNGLSSPVPGERATATSPAAAFRHAASGSPQGMVQSLSLADGGLRWRLESMQAAREETIAAEVAVDGAGGPAAALGPCTPPTACVLRAVDGPGGRAVVFSWRDADGRWGHEPVAAGASVSLGALSIGADGALRALLRAPDGSAVAMRRDAVGWVVDAR